jgi:hypothetical protein
VRYPEGTIQLNEEHDLPLLRQLAHSRFAARSQLAQDGFLDRRTAPSLGAEHIYSLTTHSGARLEEIEGRFSLSLSAEQSKMTWLPRALADATLLLNQRSGGPLNCGYRKPERRCVEPLRLLVWRRCRRLCANNSAEPLRFFT